MKGILSRRNGRLFDDINNLASLINSKQVPTELIHFKEKVSQLCETIKRNIERNLILLNIEEPSILEDILSWTEQCTIEVVRLSAINAPPILRSSSNDRLCLTIIEWLHKAHIKTEHFPAAFLDGPVSVRPFPFLPIYYFPSLEQRGLLYQPLYIHEFGHVIYSVHKNEMDDLVKELRYEILQKLNPAWKRNNGFDRNQATKRQVIADTWYKWTQELFCDAIGISIGGPCYLQAFSSYLSYFSRGDFFREPHELQYSDHPVTFLRVQFLKKRAKEKGFEALGNQIEAKWQSIANAMKIKQDFHGFYHPHLEATINSIIDDMLIEANPQQFNEHKDIGSNWDHSTDSPIKLLNLAWLKYNENPTNYHEWETKQINKLLSTK